MLTATLPPQEETEVMTIAEALRYEGRQDGLQKGLQKGRQEGALESTRTILESLLATRFSKKAYHPYKPMITKANVKTLQRWINNLFKATCIEEVFGKRIA